MNVTNIPQQNTVQWLDAGLMALWSKSDRGRVESPKGCRIK